MKSICFNLLDAYSVFFPETAKPFGGAELRGVTIASGLAKKGMDVSVVVMGYEQPMDMKVDGVRVLAHMFFSQIKNKLAYKISGTLSYFFKNKAGLRKNDFLRWYPYLIVDAEYYAAFEITTATKNLLEYCKSFQKKFLLFIASDGELSYGSEIANRMDVKYQLAAEIINYASCVFVQNSYQRDRLKLYFNKTGVKVNNPLPNGMGGSNNNRNDKKYVVWIGKSSEAKQPQVFIRLAQLFPTNTFFMVMNRNDARMYDELVKGLPANVIFKEKMTFGEVNEVMRQALVFVNTSLYEGFPNTFLQAGYFSVPVISLNVNPDNFLQSSGGGMFCNGSEDALQKSLKQLIDTPGLHEKMAKNINEYVCREHSAETIVNTIAASIA